MMEPGGRSPSGDFAGAAADIDAHKPAPQGLDTQKPQSLHQPPKAVPVNK